jgi:hypothetical protein
VSAGTPIRGHLPVVDDEYPQLLAALNAALAAAAPASAASADADADADAAAAQVFVVMELGAWYGPWAMRAAAAARQVSPGIQLLLIGVDPCAAKVAEMRLHWLRNGVPHASMVTLQVFFYPFPPHAARPVTPSHSTTPKSQTPNPKSQSRLLRRMYAQIPNPPTPKPSNLKPETPETLNPKP